MSRLSVFNVAFRVTILLSVLCYTHYSVAQTISPAQVYKLDQLFDKINRPDRPGLAVGIAYEGNLLYSKGFGMANLETGTVFSPETVSDMGSVAKQMTCLGIVLLAQEGKLSLDDSLRRFIPEAAACGSPIRIRHLIHHTSGIREVYSMLALAGWKAGDGIRQEHALDLIQHARDLNYPPGDQYLYCNTAYMLLGEIISRVTGMRFEHWMRQRIFEPLGMQHTYIMDAQGEIFPNCAESYSATLPQGWVKVYDNSTAYGQGGVYSTIPDMVRWADNFRTGRVGGASGIQQMLQRGILTNGDTLNYAFGVEHHSFRGLPIIQHTGSSAGYRTALTLVPEKGMSIIVKSNFASFNSSQTTAQILEILFEELSSAPEVAQPKTLDAQPTAAGAFDTAPFTTGLGQYYAPELEMTYAIWQANGAYWFGNRRIGKQEIKPVAPNTFQGAGGLKIELQHSKKGGVTSLRYTEGDLFSVYMEKTN